MKLLDKIIAAGEEERSTSRALARPTLRPYLLLPNRRGLARTLKGLPVLVGMACRAVRAGLRLAAAPKPKKVEQKPESKGEKPVAESAKHTKKKDEDTLGDALERVGAAMFAVVIAGSVTGGIVSTVGPRLSPYLPVLIVVGVAGLLVTAWAVAPQAAQKPQQEQAPGGEDQPKPAPLPQDIEPLDIDTVAAVVRQIAAAGGWLGAQLDDVLAHLPGRSREDLLAVLAEAGIPVVEQLKIRLPGGRQRNRQGIRLAHLPAASAQPAVEGLPELPLAAALEVAPEPAPPAVPFVVFGNE